MHDCWRVSIDTGTACSSVEPLQITLRPADQQGCLHDGLQVPFDRRAGILYMPYIARQQACMRVMAGRFPTRLCSYS